MLTPPRHGSNCSHKIADFVFLSYIYFILAVRALQCIKRYCEAFCKESRWLAMLTPPRHGSNCSHRIADFVFLSYIYFILAVRALQCIKRYCEAFCKESTWLAMLTPPRHGSNCSHKIADFVFLSYIYFILAVRALQCIKRYCEAFCKESRCLPPPPPPWLKLGS